MSRRRVSVVKGCRHPVASPYLPSALVSNETDLSSGANSNDRDRRRHRIERASACASIFVGDQQRWKRNVPQGKITVDSCRFESQLPLSALIQNTSEVSARRQDSLPQSCTTLTTLVLVPSTFIALLSFIDTPIFAQCIPTCNLASCHLPIERKIG
jgi:hypothetical protein